MPPDKIQYIGPFIEETLLVMTDEKTSFVERLHMQNNLQVKKEMQDYVTAKHNIDVFLRTRENEQWQKK